MSLGRRGAGMRRRTRDELHAPIFVVGCWRSGTTYLARAIGRHPRITHFPLETGFIPNFFDWLESEVEESEQRKQEIARRFIAGWLGSFLRQTGKQRVLEKTPPNVLA